MRPSRNRITHRNDLFGRGSLVASRVADLRDTSLLLADAGLVSESGRSDHVHAGGSELDSDLLIPGPAPVTMPLAPLMEPGSWVSLLTVVRYHTFPVLPLRTGDCGEQRGESQTNPEMVYSDHLFSTDVKVNQYQNEMCTTSVRNCNFLGLFSITLCQDLTFLSKNVSNPSDFFRLPGSHINFSDDFLALANELTSRVFPFWAGGRSPIILFGRQGSFSSI